MNITLEQGIKEVEFFMDGRLHLNPDHVQRIVDHFGEDTHEVFQEAAEGIRTLVAEGIVAEPSAQVAAELS